MIEHTGFELIHQQLQRKDHRLLDNLLDLVVLMF
jgi:hypothetical protein